MKTQILVGQKAVKIKSGQKRTKSDQDIILQEKITLHCEIWGFVEIWCALKVGAALPLISFSLKLVHGLGFHDNLNFQKRAFSLQVSRDSSFKPNNSS